MHARLHHYDYNKGTVFLWRILHASTDVGVVKRARADTHSRMAISSHTLCYAKSTDKAFPYIVQYIHLTVINGQLGNARSPRHSSSVIFTLGNILFWFLLSLPSWIRSSCVWHSLWGSQIGMSENEMCPWSCTIYPRKQWWYCINRIAII